MHESDRRVTDLIGPGSYLAVHEFSGESLDMEAIVHLGGTQWTGKVFAVLKMGGRETMFPRKRREYGSFLGYGNGT